MKFREKEPKIGADVFVAETAQLIGDVRIGNNASVWYGVVVIGNRVTKIPPHSLVAGVPGEVKRELKEEEIKSIRELAVKYSKYAMEYLT